MSTGGAPWGAEVEDSGGAWGDTPPPGRRAVGDCALSPSGRTPARTWSHPDGKGGPKPRQARLSPEDGENAGFPVQGGDSALSGDFRVLPESRPLSEWPAGGRASGDSARGLLPGPCSPHWPCSAHHPAMLSGVHASPLEAGARVPTYTTPKVAVLLLRRSVGSRVHAGHQARPPEPWNASNLSGISAAFWPTHPPSPRPSLQEISRLQSPVTPGGPSFPASSLLGRCDVGQASCLH